MAYLKLDPFLTMEKMWRDDHEHKINKIRFEKTQANGKKCRSEVTPDSGRYGVEFHLSLTKPQFETARKEQNWTGEEMFDHFTQVLSGDIKTAWEETLESDFASSATRIHQNWEDAQSKFIDRYLNCPKSRDVMLRYMETGIKKNAMTPCLNHHRRWKESLRNTKKLPVGVKPNPSEEETKEWYYRSYCRPHRNAFLTAGNKLETSTLEEICEFMRLRQKEDLDSGLLDRLTTNNSKRNDHDRRGPRSRDNHRSGGHSRGGERKPYRNSTSYRKSNDRDRDYRPARKAHRENDGNRKDYSSYSRPEDRSKRNTSYRRDSKRESRRDGNRGPKPKFYREDKQDCKVHGPCAHTWFECSQNPANQKKPSGRRPEASHHQDDDSGSEASAGSRSLLSYKSDEGSRRSSRSASADNYHAGLSDSDSDATTDGDYPGRNMHRKQAAVAFKKPAGNKPASALKKKSSKLTRHAKEQQYLAYDSSEDEFAGSK